MFDTKKIFILKGSELAIIFLGLLKFDYLIMFNLMDKTLLTRNYVEFYS